MPLFTEHSELQETHGELSITVSFKSSVALLIFYQLMRDNVRVFNYKWELSTSVLSSVIFLVSFILKLCYWVQHI